MEINKTDSFEITEDFLKSTEKRKTDNFEKTEIFLELTEKKYSVKKRK